MKNLFLAMLALTLLSACGTGIKGEAKYPTGMRNSSADQGDIYSDAPSIFGEDGIGFSTKKEERGNGSGIGVNSFFWRASLETLSFMPITSADPFGGTILTDWFQSSENPDTRYRLNVFILDKELKASALKVSMFRQNRAGEGWVDVPVPASDSRAIEDSILTKARELRLASQ